jgi:hypothetical protein
VLRGLLLTGGPATFMRAEVSGAPDQPAVASTSALWWPPSKIAGRRLAPYLARRHDELEEVPDGIVVEAPAAIPNGRRRAVIGRDGGRRLTLVRADRR